ncbi:MAG TPA: hypothetical protein DCS15_05210 [Flavobacteriales bacterium]|nr:hypothetical protein [Flavobacteriales bacterium]
MGGAQYIGLIIPVLLLAVFVEFIVARYKKVEVYTLSDTLVNICCGTLERLFDFFWVVFMYFVFVWLYDNVSLWQIAQNPLTWVVALLFGDWLAYWHHRLSHEINFLWASHIVHHQSEELNLTTVFRVSVVAVINRSFFFIWMPILGFTPAFTISVTMFIGLFQFVTHSRLVKRLGFLEKIFVTPSHHRVHHARNEKYMDHNYGHVFIFWDKLHKTFVPEEEEPEYGITTGFESGSAYDAVLFYWKDLFTRAGRAKSFGDKVRVFLKGPRYTPEGVDFLPTNFKTDENGNRLRHQIPMPLDYGIYVFLNTLTTVGLFGSMFMLKKTFENPTMASLASDPRLVSLVVMVMFGIFTHGRMIERKVGAYLLEYVRLLSIALVLPMIFQSENNSMLLSGFAIGWAVINGAWLAQLLYKYGRNKKRSSLGEAVHS